MRVERLADHHEVTTFTCGVKALDDWLSNHALENQRRNISRTSVLVSDTEEVVGYYALTMGGVRRDELPEAYRSRLPRYELGMVLLARLAIASGWQGKGHGRDLLVDALIQAAKAAQYAAARFIAVDPIDDSAKSFYRAFGLREVEGDPGGRMYLRIDHALEALEKAF